MTVYNRFHPQRRLVEYVGQPGHEATGLMLSFMALDAIADAKNTRTLPALVVIGEHVMADGRRYLEYGTPTGHIEANSDYRLHPESHHLRLQCSVCELWDGKHRKTCDR